MPHRFQLAPYFAYLSLVIVFVRSSCGRAGDVRVHLQGELLQFQQ